MTAFEKILVAFCVLLGAPITFVIGGVLAILVYEQGTSESNYPHSGFCPDSPSCYADYDAYNSLTPTP